MNRIDSLRRYMKRCGISACIIPTADPHLSEYIPSHYKLREYLCGFTGSAGTLVVTENESGLWTDGRYYLQAEKQLKAAETVLFRASEKDCIKISDYLQKNLKKGQKLGIDGRLFSKKWVDDIVLKLKGVCVATDFDSAKIWKERPAIPMEKAFILEKQFAGESVDSKINRVRETVKQNNFTRYLTSSPESIMWLLNIRGNDVKNTPVMLSYLMLDRDTVTLYCHKEKIEGDVYLYLDKHNIKVKDYDKIYDDLKKVPRKERVGTDYSTTNYCLCSGLRCDVVDVPDIICDLKSVKNETEIENIKSAYIKENTALVKSFYTIFQKDNLTEWDVCELIEENRRKHQGYISASFDTIAAYGENAAMIHYSPTPDNCALIKKEGMLLIDTGGQYYEGTTDTTRTLVMGELTKEQKENLTLVLKGNIRLSLTVFPEGTRGCDLDSVARIPLWKKSLDYRHSTGHGIGYLLSVHEGPQRISALSAVKLSANMTVSNEPGVYIPKEYGIRIENHLRVREHSASEYGKFFSFEVLNYCPIGTEGVVAELLDDEERKWLNGYNKKCVELLSPYLEKDEIRWLMEYTKEI